MKIKKILSLSMTKQIKHILLVFFMITGCSLGLRTSAQDIVSSETVSTSPQYIFSHTDSWGGLHASQSVGEISNLEEKFHAFVLHPKAENIIFLQPLKLDKNNFVLVWSECTKSTCYGYASVIGHDENYKKLVLRKRIIISSPYVAWQENGINFEPEPILLDVNNDGKLELVLKYSVVEKPRPALGSKNHEFIAVYGVPSLNRVWRYELNFSGGDSEYACYREAELVFKPVVKINVSGECNLFFCLNQDQGQKTCKSNHAVKDTFYWSKLSRQFIKK